MRLLDPGAMKDRHYREGPFAVFRTGQVELQLVLAYRSIRKVRAEVDPRRHLRYSPVLCTFVCRGLCRGLIGTDRGWRRVFNLPVRPGKLETCHKPQHA